MSVRPFWVEFVTHGRSVCIEAASDEDARQRAAPLLGRVARTRPLPYRLVNAAPPPRQVNHEPRPSRSCPKHSPTVTRGAPSDEGNGCPVSDGSAT